MHTHTHTTRYIYIYISLSLYIYIYICIYIYIYTQTYTRTRVAKKFPVVGIANVATRLASLRSRYRRLHTMYLNTPPCKTLQGGLQDLARPCLGSCKVPCKVLQGLPLQGLARSCKASKAYRWLQCMIPGSASRLPNCSDGKSG